MKPDSFTNDSQADKWDKIPTNVILNNIVFLMSVLFSQRFGNLRKLAFEFN